MRKRKPFVLLPWHKSKQHESRLADVGETMLCMGEGLILQPVRCALACAGLYSAERYPVEPVRSGSGAAPDGESEG
jgi:hypothetical protein